MSVLKHYRLRQPRIVRAFQYDSNASDTPQIDDWPVVWCHPPDRDPHCVSAGHGPRVIGRRGMVYPVEDGDWVAISAENDRWVMTDADFRQTYELVETDNA